MKKLIIPIDLIEQSDANAIIVYAIFQITFCAGEGNGYVVTDSIGEKLDYELPLTKKKREYIRNILGWLYELGYLKKKDKQYIVDTNSFYNHDRYVTCDRHVFDELYAAPDLFRHYLILKNCEGKEYSLEYFAKIEGVSISTISRRNKDLAALHLIEINTTAYDPTTGKRSGNNSYTVLN